MIEIKINQNVIAKLREDGFYPDTMLTALFAMQCVANNDTALLDMLDDYSTSKRMLLVYVDLERRGLFEEEAVGSRLLYKLTAKGDAYVKHLATLGTSKIVDDTDSWIMEWIELFPKGVKSGGKLLRSDAKSCVVKMRKFRKDYPEYASKETIFRATQAYLNQQEAKGWEFTRCAIYFIHKQGEGSDLAAYCSELKAPPSIQQMQQQIVNANSTGLV